MYIMAMKTTDAQYLVEQDFLVDVERKVMAIVKKTHSVAKQHFLDSQDFDSLNDTLTEKRWTYASSLLFAFTLITTIGYGNLTPVTFYGRLFCIIYGIVGIPLAMLTIANLGRFLLDAVLVAETWIVRFCKEMLQKSSTPDSFDRRKNSTCLYKTTDGSKTSVLSTVGAIVVFLSTIGIGAACLPLWEEMDFFTALYFSFVTVTTIGFGDIVPKNYNYLFPTLFYIIIHYLGKRIMNAREALVWFGNKVLTVNDLVVAIGKKYGATNEEILDLQATLDTMIEQTINAKATEKESTPKMSPVLPTVTTTMPFIDDDDSKLSCKNRSKKNGLRVFKT
ncbi:unnamed protein product [Soboliphyme baturini]|uniref:Ion_trans_2 domain-containing protein n=1 Tax=Soboliphyme baturini TaxID=241478 RepID=A0A183IBM6_9BILA|nr:unnamed protein product [Soboliphyme baturini]